MEKPPAPGAVSAGTVGATQKPYLDKRTGELNGLGRLGAHPSSLSFGLPKHRCMSRSWVAGKEARAPLSSASRIAEPEASIALQK